MPQRILMICFFVFVGIFEIGFALSLSNRCASGQTVSSSLTLKASGYKDQDDMTFWLHPTNLSQSTIICSDKFASRVFVYDLEGRTLQVIAVQKPGNIDIRYGFRLNNELVDIVAFNERNTQKIRVYKVNPSTRLLQQIDDSNINTGENYGFALYKSPHTGKFYAFTGPTSSTQVKQFELIDKGNGRVTAYGPLRQLPNLGTTEGMVADDETGQLYLAAEDFGIWKFNAEPNGGTSGQKIAAIGQNGLTADVEGVTIYYAANGRGYLIASSQGNGTFKVYERQSPHNFVGTFSVSNVRETDGVDVINLPLNNTFSRGIFAVHNGRVNPCPVEIVKWETIAGVMNLLTDTQYWDPRAVVSGNSVPSVTISQPSPNAVCTTEDSILFEGAASDKEDGNLSSNMVWSSNLDGYLDTGSNFTTTLSQGDHTITANVTDSYGDTGNTSVNMSVVSSGGSIVVDRFITGGSDDAEEYISGSTQGTMRLSSSDLELIMSGNTKQVVGLRFQNLGIPAGATIVRAVIEFSAYATSSEPTSLQIEGEMQVNAGTFVTTLGNISGRSRTSSKVLWEPEAWSVVGVKKTTPDLTAIVHEMVNQQGWTENSPIVFIISGSGRRIAESYESAQGHQNLELSPRLHIEFVAP